LEFDKETDVLEAEGSVYVMARYSGGSSVPDYHSVVEDGVPNWVKNFSAEVPGYLIGIGISKSKGSPQRTYQASYESAIINLLPSLGTRVTGSVSDNESGSGKVTQNITTSRGDLVRVMILETWLNRRTGEVWTLLVANEG
jgi:hypothetical protein